MGSGSGKPQAMMDFPDCNYVKWLEKNGGVFAKIGSGLEGKDFVLIGGGQANLYLSILLRNGGANITVLEARDKLAGRAEQHEFSDGTKADLGMMRFGLGQALWGNILNELGFRFVSNFPTPKPTPPPKLAPNQPAKPPAKSWAQVVQAPKLKELTPTLRDRILATKKAMAADGLQPPKPRPRNTPKPVIVARYFSGIPRGPYSKILKHLRSALPSWAVIAISFIGKNTCEILTAESHADRLATTMQLLGYKYLPRFNPTGDLVRSSMAYSVDKRRLKNLEMCHYRWNTAAERTHSHWAATWYRIQAGILKPMLDTLTAKLQPKSPAPSAKSGINDMQDIDNEETIVPQAATTSTSSSCDVSLGGRRGASPN